MNKLKKMANKEIPIEQWGDLTGLKEALEISLRWGGEECIVREALSSFREYIRDN